MMPHIRLSHVTITFPMLGRGAKPKLAGARVQGAGALIRDDAQRGRSVVALSDISLSIAAGERVGVIGRNGSGKSTLLRTIAGVYEPLVGALEVSGTVAGLFAAGLGMRPEASGYRNIELAGLVAGRSIADVREKMDEIAAFTELGEYLDMPVRTYSNGMAMRLKFACATAFTPDILLMDEWLGAGDQDFKAKARARMDDLVNQAAILVLASHNHRLVHETCDSAAWVDRGQLKAFGPSDLVVPYREGRIDARDYARELEMRRAGASIGAPTAALRPVGASSG